MQARVVVLLVLSVGLLIGVACQTQSYAAETTDLSYQGTELKDRRPAADFTLVDQNGEAASLAGSRGRVVVLSFLDSKCIDICPFTAVILRNAAKQLGPIQDKAAFVAVNTNPVANTVEDVSSWTNLHRLEEIAGWRFLTGQPEMLQQVWESYSIASEMSGGQISDTSAPGRVIHTGAVYVIDASGRERWYFSTEANASTVEPMSRLIASRVRSLLAESDGP
jgi:protein SCO1/2